MSGHAVAVQQKIDTHSMTSLKWFWSAAPSGPGRFCSGSNRGATSSILTIQRIPLASKSKREIRDTLITAASAATRMGGDTMNDYLGFEQSGWWEASLQRIFVILHVLYLNGVEGTN